MADAARIERAFFRRGADGAEVFFPWGLAHRGYRIARDEDRRKASRAAGFLISSVTTVGVVTAYLLHAAFEAGAVEAASLVGRLVWPAAALAICIGGYAARVSRLVEGLAESDLVVTREERLREAAAQVAPWQVMLAGAAVVGMGALVLWIEPRLWWLGGAAIAVGVGLSVWGLWIRRATAGGP